MSTSDHGGGSPQHEHRGDGPEGEYEDKDVSDSVAPEPVGSYEDTDPVDPAAPDDEGEFADHDVTEKHRTHLPEGEYADSQLPADATTPTDHTTERNLDNG